MSDIFNNQALVEKKGDDMLKILCSLVLFIYLLPSFAFAHPPSGIKISYDPVKEKVTVDVSHKVRDPRDHYIAEVKVYLNDVLVADKKNERQDGFNGVKMVIPLADVRGGDRISVDAECSIAGSRSAEKIVELE